MRPDAHIATLQRYAALGRQIVWTPNDLLRRAASSAIHLSSLSRGLRATDAAQFVAQLFQQIIG